MKKVYTNENMALVGIAKSYLLERNIQCVIRNEFASSVMGEVPFLDVWPELWLLDDSQYNDAVVLLKEIQEVPVNKIDWKCGTCQEINPGNFDICWQCGLSA